MVLYKGRILGALAVLALISGCVTNDPEGLEAGQEGATTESAQAGVDEQTGTKIVQGSCPKITLRDGTAYIREYARGGENDPEKIVYQAAIADTTRQCSVTGDQMTINVVVAGRAATGPAGKPGAISLPVRVAVVENRTNKVIYSELTQFETTIPEGNPTTQFIFSKPDVNIPIADSRNVRVFVGFDEGPPKRS